MDCYSFSPNNNVKLVQSRTSSKSDHSCTTTPNVTGVVIVDVGHKPYLQSHQVVADTSIYHFCQAIFLFALSMHN